MNTKEKEELREKLIDKIPDYLTNMPNEKIGFFIKKTEAEYLLKALEAFEQPLPLDADKYFNDILPIGDVVRWHQTTVTKLMQSFAQASITAKQREWDKEKAELVDAAKVAYELVPGFLRDSPLVKKVKMTISKYTNQ